MSKPLAALGMMSGTSLDGIDVAFIRTDGSKMLERGPSTTYAYSGAQRALLQAALADAAHTTDRGDRRGSLSEADVALTTWHADAARRFCQAHGMQVKDIDIVGFHGQTVIHRPERRLTVQLGDGAALARQLGVPVAHDMRAADVAQGGQGAPLVPVYHLALAASLEVRPVAFVNIGGVANVTWIGPNDDLLAFDTGPGNALLDDWMLKNTGTARDEGGAASLRGRVAEEIVSKFMENPYFRERAPKSLDRNSFSDLDLRQLSTDDGAATLVALTARSIAAARQHMADVPGLWVICGGGRHNAAIMRALHTLLTEVVQAEDCGFNGDSVEAEAWAYLAVRSLRGLALSYPGTTGVSPPMTGGIIFRP